MRARKLKHFIEIQKSNKTTNDFGEHTFKWKSFLKTWASIEKVNENENFIKNQIKESATIKFRIRFVDNLNFEMRINYKNKFFNIVEIVNPYYSNKELLILAKEI